MSEVTRSLILATIAPATTQPSGSGPGVLVIRREPSFEKAFRRQAVGRLQPEQHAEHLGLRLDDARGGRDRGEVRGIGGIGEGGGHHRRLHPPERHQHVSIIQPEADIVGNPGHVGLEGGVQDVEIAEGDEREGGLEKCGVLHLRRQRLVAAHRETREAENQVHSGLQAVAAMNQR